MKIEKILKVEELSSTLDAVALGITLGLYRVYFLLKDDASFSISFLDFFDQPSTVRDSVEIMRQASDRMKELVNNFRESESAATEIERRHVFTEHELPARYYEITNQITR